MLSVTNKPFLLSVIMLSVVMLSVIMLSVVMLNVVAPFQPRLIFVPKVRGGVPLFSLDQALPLPANIRLGRKGLTVTNTLAYFKTELIAAVKSLIVLAP
jgi:hypothetical protein